MKSFYNRLKKLGKDKKAVFGLTSVQEFFAIILGVALLAYVIVVIMGTLNSSTILPASSLSANVVNETGGFLNGTGYTLANAGVLGFASPSITTLINNSGLVIPAGNYTVTAAGIVQNTTGFTAASVNITYTYKYNTAQLNSANSILTNVSGGITSFFSSISPVYAILAILVIILVLVVLVRVVSGSTGAGRRSAEPQL